MLSLLRQDGSYFISIKEQSKLLKMLSLLRQAGQSKSTPKVVVEVTQNAEPAAILHFIPHHSLFSIHYSPPTIIAIFAAPAYFTGRISAWLTGLPN